MLRFFQCELRLEVSAVTLVWQVFYFIGFFQRNIESLRRYWIHTNFTFHTTFLCSDADGAILYSHKKNCK